MTDNIRLMTQYEINKLTNKCNTPIYGTFDYVFEPEISLGNGNKDNLRTIQTINHETIHEVLTLTISREISFKFDRDLYYNFNTCKNGDLCKGTIIRETLISFFTIDNEILI